MQYKWTGSARKNGAQGIFCDVSYVVSAASAQEAKGKGMTKAYADDYELNHWSAEPLPPVTVTRARLGETHVCLVALVGFKHYVDEKSVPTAEAIVRVVQRLANIAKWFKWFNESPAAQHGSPDSEEVLNRDRLEAIATRLCEKLGGKARFPRHAAAPGMEIELPGKEANSLSGCWRL